MRLFVLQILGVTFLSYLTTNRNKINPKCSTKITQEFSF